MSMDQAPARPADLGAYLRALRRGRWLSLRAVEAQGGVSNSYLSQIETGRIAQPSPHVLQKLATVYDVPVETLLARAGYIRPAPPVRAPDWPARTARAVNAPTARAPLAALETLAEGWDMSMNQAPENNLPPPSDDGAPTLDSLWGIAPNATGGAPSEDWVRRRRSESDPPPPGTGLRLGGDWTRERDALRKQVEACEDDNTRLRAQLAHVTEQWQQAEAHNNDVNANLAAVRTWAQEAQRAATNRLGQGSPDPRYWQAQLDAAAAVWALVKPVV